MNRLARAMDQLLVWFILFQMIALTAVVIFAVVARITGIRCHGMTKSQPSSYRG